MLEPNVVTPVAARAPAAETVRQRLQLRRFTWTIVGISLAFGRPLVDLVHYSASSTLYSHIPLIPFISLYLAWSRRGAVFAAGRGNATLGLCATLIAALSLAVPAIAGFRGILLAEPTHLALIISAYVALIVAAAGWLLDPALTRAVAFPLAFLLFMIPLPPAWVAFVELGLQHGSAAVAIALLDIARTPVFYHDLLLQLPGITLHVAPECSGIHSTLALLMVSLLAGYSFLRSPLHAGLLAMAVLPLALFRNGLRIFTVAELCVHGGPAMIDSPIHRRGGPVFFALSLIPLFLLLAYLMRREQRVANRTRRAAR